jgi:hypothetical protein
MAAGVGCCSDKGALRLRDLRGGGGSDVEMARVIMLAASLTTTTRWTTGTTDDDWGGGTDSTRSNGEEVYIHTTDRDRDPSGRGRFSDTAIYELGKSFRMLTFASSI